MQNNFNQVADRHAAAGIIDTWGLDYTTNDRGAFEIWNKAPRTTGLTRKVSALAKEVFGSETAVIRYNMADFSSASQLYSIIGAPPGYMGSDEESGLGKSLRQNPRAILLLDEVEKADPRIMATLDEFIANGVFTDARGSVHSMEGVIPVKVMEATPGVEWQSRVAEKRERALDRDIAASIALRQDIAVNKPLSFRKQPVSMA